MGRRARLGASILLPRLHALLERPWLYRLTGWALAPGATRILLAGMRSQLAAMPAGRMLDLGSGPRSRLALAGVSPVGVDLSLSYARELRRAGGLAVVGRAGSLPFRSDSFAGVWSFGLLHHLPDTEVRAALAEAQRVAGSGRVVVFDGVLPHSRWRRPLAWALRRLDRGPFQRAEAALCALLPADGSWRVSRLTYSATGLEGVWCAR
jgi:SAM-dependent methyltransferase